MAPAKDEASGRVPDDLRKRYPGAEAFRFGDSQELSDWLVSLVGSGMKTASCGALRDFHDEGEALPKVGRRDIVLDWGGEPALVIETLSVEFMKFSEVPEDFALAEGENDTLQGWRDGHREFFVRNGGFDPEMDLVCERFRLVADLRSGGDC